jgi:hypothetical protein
MAVIVQQPSTVATKKISECPASCHGPMVRCDFTANGASERPIISNIHPPKKIRITLISYYFIDADYLLVITRKQSAFTRKLINDSQYPDRMPIRQLVADESADKQWFVPIACACGTLWRRAIFLRSSHPPERLY